MPFTGQLGFKDDPIQPGDIQNPICFIELELTHSDPYLASIAEIAVTVMDGKLKKQCQIMEFVIRDSDIGGGVESTQLDRFTMSGLLKVLDSGSDTLVTLQEAETQIIKKLDDLGIMAKSIPTCGLQASKDRLVLDRQMPLLNQFLSFTIIDLSSIDEVAQRWNKKIYSKKDIKKSDESNTQRAGPRVKKAIERLKYYQERLFKTKHL